MNLSIDRQAKPVSNRPNALENLVRTEIVWSQLVAALDGKGNNLSVKKAQPHPLADIEAQLSVVLVMVVRVVLLNLLKPLSHSSKEVAVVTKEMVNNP